MCAGKLHLFHSVEARGNNLLVNKNWIRKLNEKFGDHIMGFIGKKLEELVVTLPLADGTELECGVFNILK